MDQGRPRSAALRIRTENPDPGGAPIKDQLAFVERERSGYFKWETYTDPHLGGAAPSRDEAQQAAEKALREAGAL